MSMSASQRNKGQRGERELFGILSDLLGTAASNSGKGQAFLEPGLKYGVSTTSKIDFLSLGIALVLGTAGLPHILIRFYTVPTSRDARKSVLWAIGLIGVLNAASITRWTSQ